jgi:hypothetical protein
MRTPIQALTELLEPRVVESGPLELREDDPGSSCPTTKITKSGQTVALRFAPWNYSPQVSLPTNRWLFPLLDVSRDTPPACRSCDYIVFHAPRKTDAADPSLFVFLFELKSGRPKGAVAQLRNGKLIADYLLSVAKLHGKVDVWPPVVRYRGIVLAGKSPGFKASTRVDERAPYAVDSRCPDLGIVNLRPGSSYPLTFFCN